MAYIKRFDTRDAFGERLREERLRLGFSQEQLASRAVIRKQAQLKYETAETSPTMDYIYRVAREGVDIVYLLTGVRVGDCEDALLWYYRHADKLLQEAAVAVLRVGDPPPMGIERMQEIEREDARREMLDQERNAQAHQGPQVTGGNHGMTVLGGSVHANRQEINVAQPKKKRGE